MFVLFRRVFQWHLYVNSIALIELGSDSRFSSTIIVMIVTVSLSDVVFLTKCKVLLTIKLILLYISTERKKFYVWLSKTETQVFSCISVLNNTTIDEMILRKQCLSTFAMYIYFSLLIYYIGGLYSPKLYPSARKAKSVETIFRTSVLHYSTFETYFSSCILTNIGTF